VLLQDIPIKDSVSSMGRNSIRDRDVIEIEIEIEVVWFVKDIPIEIV